MSGEQVRVLVLEVVKEFSQRGPGYFQSGSVLKEVKKRFNTQLDLKDEQAILTFWSDLFRSGHLAWGYDLSNIGPPFCHLTEQGRKTLQHYSRDPVNIDGYLAHLTNAVNLENITLSYLHEALVSYNSNCFKATAVMVGCASESMILDLRNKIVFKWKEKGKNIPRNLEDWRIKRVVDSIENEIQSVKSEMPNKLFEDFQAYWPALVQQIRTVRNDAGHPKLIETITQESVHASLLLFPELAKMTKELIEWIDT